ncbi:MAG: peptidylprolyl isomerase [Planctomycetota bacterium]|nr:peptidylprolyl isomerase [Planctomycetota bacterium]
MHVIRSGMGRHTVWAALFACLAVRAFGAADQAPPGLESIPEIVARVDNVELTRRELIRELVGTVSQPAVDRLIRRLLVEQACAKAGVNATDQELEDQIKIDEINLRNEMRLVPGDVNERTLADLVHTRFQMTLDEYKHMVVRQRLLAEKAVGRNLKPTLPDLQRFYRFRPYAANKKNSGPLTNLTVEEILQPPIRYRAAHILISPLNPGDMYRGIRLKNAAGEKAELAKIRQARMEQWKKEHVQFQDQVDLDLEPEWQLSLKRAQECLKELKEKKISWEQAVEKYSQDPHDLHPNVEGRRMPSLREKTLINGRPMKPGEVGWFTREGPMVQEFYEGAKDLRMAGELAGPVRTQFGYHIIMLMENVDIPKQKTFDELRPQVEKIYVSWLLQAYTNQWLERLQKDAKIEVSRTLLWYPDPAIMEGKEDPDPVVVTVNGTAIRRSEVWREMLRADGPEALDRLINREMALGPLKRLGPARLEWEGKRPDSRAPTPPAIQPVAVTLEELDRQLTDERLRLEVENEKRKKENKAPLTLDQFIREAYGESLKEYMRAMEAGVVLGKSVRMKTDLDEARLMFEFYLAQEQYEDEVSFQIEQIVLKVKPDADAATRQSFIEMAGDLRKDYLAKRKTWEDIAKLVRDPKDPSGNEEELMRLTSENDKYPEIYDYLAKQNLEKDHVSEPIVSRFGVHLVRVRKRMPGRVPEFEDVKERVTRDYLESRAAMCMDIWLRSVRNQAKVRRFVFSDEKIEIPDTLPLPTQ